MGLRTWHLARAKHHKKVADDLHSQLGHDDWAVVALFYSALHYVHSMLNDEPDLGKDERHPRKHTAPPGPENGGRGVNQLVRDLYGSIRRDYASLFEASRRTRYDFDLLKADDPYSKLLEQHRRIEAFTTMRNAIRPERRDNA